MGDPLRSAKRWLRRHFPGREPVVVRRVQSKQLKLDAASCYEVTDWWDHDTRGRICRIRVASDVRVDYQIEALLHGWAHYLDAHIPDWRDREDHSPTYDAMHGVIRRRWFGEHAEAAKRAVAAKREG